MSQLFTWVGQSTGVSALASLLPKNTQHWSPLEWTGWISLQSKELSRVFSNPRTNQMVRTHTKETTWIQDLASPNHQYHPVHLKNKQNKNTNPIISRQDYHLIQPFPSEEKQINKNSPYAKLTQTTGPTNQWLVRKPKEGRNQKEETIQPSSRK